MKAITICQPYPFLILAPQAELPKGVERKRVENRTWEMLYRGPLLIHAGKSEKYLMGWDRSKFPALDFGAILGVVDVVECFATCQMMGPQHTWAKPIAEKYSWLPRHQHTEGPFCIVMENPRRFAKPIPYLGSLKIFDVPDGIVAEALEAVA